MLESDKFHFESFEADSKEFDSRFFCFLDNKYNSGWKYKSCDFNTQGNKRHAYCLFKRED